MLAMHVVQLKLYELKIKYHIFIQKSFNKYQCTRSSLDFKYSQYWESTEAFQQAIDRSELKSDADKKQRRKMKLLKGEHHGEFI